MFIAAYHALLLFTRFTIFVAGVAFFILFRLEFSLASAAASVVCSCRRFGSVDILRRGTPRLTRIQTDNPQP